MSTKPLWPEHPPGRPMIVEETIRRAVEKMAAARRWDEQEVDDIVRCFERFDDGYKLAKELESCCYWDIDAQQVSDLDDVSFAVDQEHRQDCIEWAKANDIQPPLPIGTHIREGVITGISKYSPATYEVQRPNDPPTTKALILFEDAKATEVA
jgi:hypothetical protein